MPTPQRGHRPGTGLTQESVPGLIAERLFIGARFAWPGRAKREFRRQGERRASHDRELVRRVLAETEGIADPALAGGQRRGERQSAEARRHAAASARASPNPLGWSLAS